MLCFMTCFVTYECSMITCITYDLLYELFYDSPVVYPMTCFKNCSRTCFITYDLFSAPLQHLSSCLPMLLPCTNSSPSVKVPGGHICDMSLWTYRMYGSWTLNSTQQEPGCESLAARAWRVLFEPCVLEPCVLDFIWFQRISI